MWWCVVVRPRPAAACVCVVCMLACAFVLLLVWVGVGVVGVCCSGGDTARVRVRVCDARGVVGGLSCACACVGGAERSMRGVWHERGVCRCACWVQRVGGTRVCVVDRVVMSGWFVCICVDTRCAGGGVVCAGGGSVWLCGWVCGCGGAREGGRSVGGVVCVWCGGLRWLDASLTYLGVFAGRQVGGVRQ